MVLMLVMVIVFSWYKLLNKDLFDFDAARNDICGMIALICFLWWLLLRFAGLSEPVSAKEITKILVNRATDIEKKKGRKHPPILVSQLSHPNQELFMTVRETNFLTKLKCVDSKMKLFGFSITNERVHIFMVRGLITLPVVLKLLWTWILDHKEKAGL